MPRVRCVCGIVPLPLPPIAAAASAAGPSSSSVLCLVLGIATALVWIAQVQADCLYEDRKYEEGVEVSTLEPCLNCTCSKGALLCYLRVCPGLPNPPPPGCILLHRYRTCCPELICTDFPVATNEIEGRSEPEDGLILENGKAGVRNACIANGTIYGPGSAMDSSSQCEYCYCLGGQQRCVKPRCLLPIEGCTPIYENHTCCPAHYNCTRPALTTTTVSPQKEKDGCMVSGQFYPEGGKVLGVGHSVCDNCYCLRGLLRCEPLSCAPPLLGCTPVIKPGECCAASYNCSGTIEIDPEPNYGETPVISKEYAKLRKEFHQTKQTTAATQSPNAPFYVIAESSGSSTQKMHRIPGNFGTTRHFSGFVSHPSTKNPYHYQATQKNELDKTFPSVYYATTNYKIQDINYKRPLVTKTYEETTASIRDRNKGHENRRVTDYEDMSDTSILKLMNSLLETHLGGEDGSPTESSWGLDLLQSLFKDDNETTAMTASETQSTETPTKETEDYSSESTVFTADTTFQTNSETETTTEVLKQVTFMNVLNSTDCIENEISDVEHRHSVGSDASTVGVVDASEINNLQEVTNFNFASTEGSTSTEDDISEINLESKVDVAKATPKPLLPKIELLQNLTKIKEEGLDYDYNDLPPSLPNLRIIPFVAADALDSKKEANVDNPPSYPLVPERITEPPIFSYTNLFSPPVETEGGFIPKNPPILEGFYENAYLTTAPEINAVTPALNGANAIDRNCISSGEEVHHGQSVASNTPCMTCICLYGTIVCQQIECPPVEPGCKLTNLQEQTCCPQYICDNNPPPAALDRLDPTVDPEESITHRDAPPTPNPFKDVIKTEPAPDLPSLMGDMMPFFVQKTTPGVTTSQPTEKPQSTTPHEQDQNSFNFFFDKIFELFPGDNNTGQIQTSTHVFSNKTADDRRVTAAASSGRKPDQLENRVDNNGPGLGLLKLAGCNIYGRMYRVGRIISELSGPCMECKCTEVGVQCRDLRC